MRFLQHRIHAIGFSLVACFLFSAETFAQSAPEDLQTVLGEQILAPSAALLQMKSFILSRVPPPPAATLIARCCVSRLAAGMGQLLAKIRGGRDDRDSRRIPSSQTAL